MTRRLRFPDGSVETFRDDDECDLNFSMLAYANRQVDMTTEDGRPLASARNGRIEERDLVLAGTPIAVTTPTDRFMSNMRLERARSRFVLASYIPAAEAEMRFDQATSAGPLTMREMNARLNLEPSLDRRPPLAYPLVLAALIVFVIIGAIVQTAANLSAGVQ